MCFSSSSRSGAIRFRCAPCCVLLISPFLHQSPPTIAIIARFHHVLRTPTVPRPPPGGTLIRPPGRLALSFFFRVAISPEGVSDRFSFSSSTFREIGAFLLSLANPQAGGIALSPAEEGEAIWTCKFSPSTRRGAASQKGTVLRKRKRECEGGRGREEKKEKEREKDLTIQ